MTEIEGLALSLGNEEGACTNEGPIDLDGDTEGIDDNDGPSLRTAEGTNEMEGLLEGSFDDKFTDAEGHNEVEGLGLDTDEGLVVGPADEMAGLEDGDRDGVVEGALLGAFVGDELGLFDGDCEGPFVGELVGDVDGDFVSGVGLADAEGELVMVGVELGLPEGDADGVSLGLDVGLEVGELVGFEVTFL
eukprot:scaffold33364_cov26-Cyclotella_meneghiniana.AAC.2